LSDFQPKGEVARSLGVYLDEAGITDRATIFIDSSGIVRYAESATPSGRRDIAKLLAECERVDREFDSPTADVTEPAGIGEGAVLYVKSRCGFSRAALLAHSNLHLDPSVQIKNVSEDPAALEALIAVAGKDQAPCLVVGGEAQHEAAEIVERLANGAAPLT